jgi:hypothetical protein
MLGSGIPFIEKDSDNQDENISFETESINGD